MFELEGLKQKSLAVKLGIPAVYGGRMSTYRVVPVADHPGDNETVGNHVAQKYCEANRRNPIS
jgi:hypothetical protein